MLHFCLAILLSACPLEQDNSIICNRAYSPVCAGGIDYANECVARVAGFSGDCYHNVKTGTCSSLARAPPLSCTEDEVFSELGHCVPRPWSDFVSCATEKGQGACRGGRDPNAWVIEHCALTCQA